MNKRSSTCRVPACDRTRKAGQLLCGRCWNELPDELRDRFWETSQHTAGRLQMCREILEYVSQYRVTPDGG